MKTNATELARVSQHKRVIALKKHEMIVLSWSIIWRFDPDFPSHAEMNAKPVVSGKFEEHAFSARVQAEKFFAD